MKVPMAEAKVTMMIVAVILPPPKLTIVATAARFSSWVPLWTRPPIGLMVVIMVGMVMPLVLVVRVLPLRYFLP